MLESQNFLLAGGGTAGHVNPLLALAGELRGRGHRVYALGTKTGLEAELVTRQGIELFTIPKVPLPRRPSLDLFRLPDRLLSTRHQVEQILTEKQISAVVGFGGYVSTPAYLAARRAGLPVVIHEQNAVPGLANRLGARWAHTVAVTFAGTPLKARGGKTVQVGLPLRPELLTLAKKMRSVEDRQRLRESAAADFGLDPTLPTVLVTGGSLGALHLNEVVVASQKTKPAQVQVVHLCGKGKDTAVREQTQGDSRYAVRDYLLDMSGAYALADLVVCRAGAGTVSELSALGLPAMFVPLPIGNGEQRKNAAEVVGQGGAVLVEDAAFDTGAMQEVWNLVTDAKKLRQMSAQAAKCGRLDAGECLADLVEQVKQ